METQVLSTQAPQRTQRKNAVGRAPKETKPSVRFFEKERIAQIREQFSRFIDTQVHVTWNLANGSVIEFNTFLLDVKQSNITNLVDPPDKRQKPDGSMYTPPVLTFVCRDGDLHFVLEDCTIQQKMLSIVIQIGSITVHFTSEGVLNVTH